MDDVSGLRLVNTAMSNVPSILTYDSIARKNAGAFVRLEEADPPGSPTIYIHVECYVSYTVLGMNTLHQP